MFKHYYDFHSVQHLMSRFDDMLKMCQVEFLLHLEKKKDTWQDASVHSMVWKTEEVAAKLTVAFHARDAKAVYDELIDLMLMCLMTGTLLRKELKEREQEKT
jgi:hypothetical protein